MGPDFIRHKVIRKRALEAQEVLFLALLRLRGAFSEEADVAPEGKSTVLHQIQSLKAQQAALKDQKAKLQKDLKIAVKKKVKMRFLIYS